jgi:murein DD-endopeptidase MepM/ murein hydrolase activator NlpD
MGPHRTTPRRLLFFIPALLVGIAAGTAGAQEPLPPPGQGAGSTARGGVPQLLFPVVGHSTFTDDYGDPRGHGRHAGNDIMAPRRAPAVAVEAGTIRFHTTSARAGCMLYLNGASGTQYLYIHLNNDLTRENDNRGRCVAGVAYARGLRSGARVAAGELIGYVGDSGDAEGIAPHLHFEIHPRGGRDVNPYQHLRRAKRLLFAARPGQPFTAALRGRVVGAFATALTLDVAQASSWPGGLRVPSVNRRVDLHMPPETAVFNPLGALITGAKLDALRPGQPAVAWTQRALATLQAQLGEPFSLSTEKIVLS